MISVFIITFLWQKYVCNVMQESSMHISKQHFCHTTGFALPPIYRYTQMNAHLIVMYNVLAKQIQTTT